MGIITVLLALLAPTLLQAGEPDPCEQPDCWVSGRCHPYDAKCKPRSTAECTRNPECAGEGECFLDPEAGKCVVAPDKGACAATSACKHFGLCVDYRYPEEPDTKLCAALDDKACARSLPCRHNAQCPLCQHG